MAETAPPRSEGTELAAIVISLAPAHTATFPANQSRAAHAWFLRLVASADPDLAARLHDEAQVKPFTCSNLWRSGRRTAVSDQQSAVSDQPSPSTPHVSTCSPGETWQMRYTTLSAELTGLWLDRVLPSLPAEVALGEATFRVLGAALSPQEHPWAGQSSYADLGAPYLLSGAPTPTRWKFAFAAPTTFRSGGHTVPMPLPDLLFGSLLDRWNAFAPVALQPEVRRFAHECVAVSNYALRTRALPGKEGAVQRGAVGRCDYTALNRDRYWCSALSALAAFAFYSGAGYQTTQGMGMCRWVEG